MFDPSARISSRLLTDRYCPSGRSFFSRKPDFPLIVGFVTDLVREQDVQKVLDFSLSAQRP